MVHRSTISGIRGIYKPEYGDKIANLGALTKNMKPKIVGFTQHGLQRMAERGVSKSLVQQIVKKGYAILQPANKKSRLN